MKKLKYICLMFIMTLSLFISAGCSTGSAGAGDGSEKSSHPVITMNAPYLNMSRFYEFVHEKYPEINLEIEPYDGQNLAAYTIAMRKSGNLPDIYFTPTYNQGSVFDKENFLDLAGYAFTDNFAQSRLREVVNDGGIYMLPLSYNAFGITYNKTLLEKNGWKLPQSLVEMEELKKEVEAAGYIFCRVQLQDPESGFQYLCNICDTAFLSTIDGIAWQKKFLAGEATVAGTPEMVETLQLLERWRDIGLLNGDGTPDSDIDTRKQMLEGSTLFLIGNSSDLNADSRTEYEFGLMPYLSEDGSQNVFILKADRFVGLNKELGEAGQETKLQDALHIMELLSTQEGIEALAPEQKDSRLLPLKAAVVSDNNYYKDIIDDLNDGNTASYIYAGWENIIDFLGGRMVDYIHGRVTIDDVIGCFDENQYLITNDITFFYTQAEEVISTEDCARIVGICFAKAVGSEAALVSINPWKFEPNEYKMNTHGVSGRLFPGRISNQEITSILPTGWKGNIMTVTLSGKRIKELAEIGYDLNGNGDTFPYVLVTKGNVELDDATVYTIPICGASEQVKKEGNIKDSGIWGLGAAENYFFDLGPTFGAEDIVWE